MKMKALALAVSLSVATVSIVSAVPVHASGIPVIDAANLANAIQQYTRAWVGVKKMTRVLAVDPLVDDAHVATSLTSDEGAKVNWSEAR